MRVTRVLSALVLAMMLGAPGSAATFAGKVTVVGAFADPGLVIGVAPGSGFSTPDLRPGESHRFDAFRLWTDSAAIKFDDRLPQPIAAQFTFYDLGVAGVVTGRTVGEQVGRYVQQGSLTWDAPLVLRFGPGQSGQFTLALSDALFNKGFRGLSRGAQNGAVVSATLTYDLAPTALAPVAVAPIPLPAALPLLLGAIGLMGAATRRRR